MLQLGQSNRSDTDVHKMGAGFLRTERTGGFCESILYVADRTGPWLDYQNHSGLPGEFAPVVGGLGIEGNPEWASGSTAWFVVFLGLYQLLFLHHSMSTVRLLSVLIVMNGISSSANHLGHDIFMSFVDGATMQIPVDIAACTVFDTVIYLRTRQCGSPRCMPWAHAANGMLWFLVCGVKTWFVGMWSIDPFVSPVVAGTGSSFVLLFNVPIVAMVVVAIGLVSCGKGLLGEESQSQLKPARVYLGVGAGSYAFGLAMWLITENSGLCGEWTYVNAMEAVEPDEVGWRYSAPALPDGFIALGHALWHIFAAYGLHCMVCLVIFIRAPLHGTHCYFLRSKNLCVNIWLLVFPIVKYARDPLAAESWKLAPAAAPNVEV